MDDERKILQILQFFPKLPAADIIKYLKKNGEARIRVLSPTTRN